MTDRQQDRFYPIENKYMIGAAVVGFLLALFLTGGIIIVAFGVLALIGGIGWGINLAYADFIARANGFADRFRLPGCRSTDRRPAYPARRSKVR
jgi:hypothetical protein